MHGLIHLNGPSGIGKSTLSSRYVDEHEGALNLDPDRLIALFGGWRRSFDTLLPVARRMAARIADIALAEQRTVIVPQLTTSDEEVRPFEEIARSNGVEYVEVALWMRPETLVERQRHRLRYETDPVVAGVAGIIERNGGDRLVAKICDDYAAFQRSRPHAIWLDLEGRTVEEAYLALKGALEGVAADD